jgi:hypothetical protein
MADKNSKKSLIEKRDRDCKTRIDALAKLPDAELNKLIDRTLF